MKRRDWPELANDGKLSPHLTAALRSAFVGNSSFTKRERYPKRRREARTVTRRRGWNRFHGYSDLDPR